MPKGNLRSFLEKTQFTIRQIRTKVANLKKATLEKEGAPPPVIRPLESTTTMRVTFDLHAVARTTALILLLLVLAYFIYQIRDILILFFVALLFASALDPLVDRLQIRGVPRGISVLLLYIMLFGVLAVFLSSLIPLIAKEVTALALRIQELIGNLASGTIPLPSFLEWLRPYLQQTVSSLNLEVLVGNLQGQLVTIGQKLTAVTGNVVQAIISISNGVFNAILFFVITFFMVVDERGIEHFVLSLFSSRHTAYITEKSQAIKHKLGDWLRGQVLLMISIGILMYIGYAIIGLQYAVTLAFLAGLFEFLPYIGPLLAWVAALPIAANQSAWLVLWVTIVTIIVQQLENNILVPFIMKKAVGLSPVLTIFAMLVGFEFLGILGIVLAIPVAATTDIFVKDYAGRTK